MTAWEQVVSIFLGYWWVWFFLLPAAITGLSGVLEPMFRALRMVGARRRFIESQGAKLQNPQNADARFQLANIYAEGWRWRRALEYAEEAVRTARENPLFEGQVPYHFLRLLGDARLARGKYAEAEAAFREALGAKADLGHGEARFGLGKALLLKGDPAGAVEALRLAVDDNASNLEAYWRLAQASALAGREADVPRIAAEFRRVARALPGFAGKHRFRYRLKFLLFPVARHFR